MTAEHIQKTIGVKFPGTKVINIKGEEIIPHNVPSGDYCLLGFGLRHWNPEQITMLGITVEGLSRHDTYLWLLEILRLEGKKYYKVFNKYNYNLTKVKP